MSSILQQVLDNAKGYKNGADVNLGRGGLCWEFVHKVLTVSGAKSYPDYQPPPADARYQPYGERDTKNIRPGYVIVFIGVVLKQKLTTEFAAHIGFVERIEQGGRITIVHQNHNNSGKISRFSFRQGEKTKGVILYFKPVAKGK